MSNQTIIYLVLASAGVFSLGLWIGLVVVPASSSYARIWERVVATALSLYVLATLAVVGAIAGGLVLYYYPELF